MLELAQSSTKGRREAFIKRYVVERTNEAEIRPEEQSEKKEGCWESLWHEIQSGQAQLFM